jgi:hypothetical protein
MPILYLSLAALLLIAASILAAAIIFYIAFPWWTDRVLRSNSDVQGRLRLEISGDRVVWSIAPSVNSPYPYVPLICAVLAGIVVIAAEAAIFASTRQVPQLWYIAGAGATALLILVSLVIATLFKRPLRRITDRALERHANNAFWFAAHAITDICGIARHVDRIYASLGLKARSNLRELCAQSLFENIRSGRDFALSQMLQLKDRAEADLRNLQYFARLLSNTRIAIEQAKLDPGLSHNSQGAIAQIDNQVHSRELTDALEHAQWSHADRLLEAIGLDLGRVLDVGVRDSLTPESIEDAYQVLNVTEDTPLETIKAVVNTYRRIWHPDLARGNEVKRHRCVLRMQQINAAWDIIQKARTKRLTHVGGESTTVS